MLIAPNVTAIPSINPAVEAGAAAIVREMNAQAQQVTTATPYFKLESDNQPKQQLAERRPVAGAQAKTPEAAGDEGEDDAVIYGTSTLYLAQMFSQGYQQAEYESGYYNDHGDAGLSRAVSAFDALLFNSYIRTAGAYTADLPTPQSFIV